MSTTHRSTRIRTIGATAAITVGLVAGGAGIAAAGSALAPHADGPEAHGVPHRGPMGQGGGTVTAVSPTSLTVTALDGTSTTYALTSTTTFEKGPGTTVTASDVVVGAHVFVVAATSNASEAASVHLVEPRLAGTVETVSGSTITIADEQGFWHTIDVSGSTTFASTGSSSSAPASDVTAGTFISASGAIAKDHTTLDATSISIGVPTPPAHGTGPVGSGRVHHDKD